MTWFDLIVIGVLGLSILFAALRGFSREFTTLIALGLGVIVAYYSATPLAEFFGSGSTMTAIICFAALFGLVFIASLIGLNILVSRYVAEKPGRIDRWLGVAFGFLRGYLLVGLGFLAADYYFEDDKLPDAIENGVTLGLAASAGAVLESMGLDTAPEPETSDTSDMAALDAAIKMN